MPRAALRSRTALPLYALRRSSEGYRPPQDDSLRTERSYFAFRMSLSRSGFDSSRTRCGYISPPW